jgi:predicted DNA-binding transcriptional regulator AlpA
MTNPNTPELPNPEGVTPRLLTRRLLRQLVPVSDMTIWRWERDRGFPKHISIYGRNYWILGEVEQWLADRQHDAGDDARGGG